MDYSPHSNIGTKRVSKKRQKTSKKSYILAKNVKRHPKNVNFDKKRQFRSTFGYLPVSSNALTKFH